MNDHQCEDIRDIDDHLAPRAFLFADSGSYRAGVAEAVAAMHDLEDQQELDDAPPSPETAPTPAPETAPSAA